jgi:hypothetical protein
MRTGRTGTAEIIGFLVGTTLFAVVLAAGAVRAAQQVDGFGPTIGDIVDFAPGSIVPAERSVRLGAQIAGATGACLLDVSEMAAGGGSLVIETREEESYRIHWAGGRTSQGSADCGNARDLLVSRPDLDQLALAAGGFGVAGNRTAMPLTGAQSAAP